MHKVANTGPGLLNRLVERGPSVLNDSISGKLVGMEGMPQAVERQVATIRGGVGAAAINALCKALIEQGAPANDAVELSWAAVGRDLQEATFAQVRAAAAHLIAMLWGVDASDYVASVQPLISDHRFKGVIDAYGRCAMTRVRGKSRR